MLVTVGVTVLAVYVCHYKGWGWDHFAYVTKKTFADTSAALERGIEATKVAVCEAREQLEARIQEVREDVSGVREDVAAARESLGAEIAGARQDIGQVLDDVSSVNGRVQEVSSELRALAEAAATKEQVQALQGAVGEVRGIGEQTQETIAQLQATMASDRESQQDSLAQLQSVSDGTRDAMGQLQSSVDALHSEHRAGVDMAQQAVLQMKASLDALRHEQRHTLQVLVQSLQGTGPRLPQAATRAGPASTAVVAAAKAGAGAASSGTGGAPQPMTAEEVLASLSAMGGAHPVPRVSIPRTVPTVYADEERARRGGGNLTGPAALTDAKPAPVTVTARPKQNPRPALCGAHS